MLVLWLLTAFAANPFAEVDQATTPTAKLDLLLPLTEKDTTASEAWSRTARALSDEPALAVLAWAKAFEADPDSEGAAEALELADGIGDVDVVALHLADRAEAPGEGDARSLNALRIARALFRDGQLSATDTWLKRVDSDAPAFADSESLRGVLLATRGKPSDALVPLQTARALGTTLEKGRLFDDKLLMNIARAYYADKNYGQALYHYALVPRDSVYWPEARFEKAWSHFRAGDAAGAIGELETHQSPFFDELWFPEAAMLRAQSLFVMCRYGSAIDAMDAYQKRYEPRIEAIDRALGGIDAQGAFDDVVQHLEGAASTLPGILLRPYRGEDRFANARRAVAAYREAAGDTGTFGDRAEILTEWAETRAEAIAEREGARVLDRVKRQRSEVSGMLADLELARIDILDRESRMYERAAATGQLEPLDRKAELKKVARDKKGYRVWPFEGEYWVDELGWYTVTGRSMCPPEKK